MTLAGCSESPAPVEWQFLQCFGERTPGEEVQEGAWAAARPAATGESGRAHARATCTRRSPGARQHAQQPTPRSRKAAQAAAPPGGARGLFGPAAAVCAAHACPAAARAAADVISAVEFDGDGSYLATGDKGGRVVLFEKVATQPVSSSSSTRGDCGAACSRRRRCSQHMQL